MYISIFLNIDQNSSKKNYNRNMYILISNLLSESFFDLGKWSTENMQIRIFEYVQFDHFPKTKIDSESRFEMKMSILLF